MDNCQIASIKKLGIHQILIRWEAQIDRILLNHILNFQELIEHIHLRNFDYSIKGYNELALMFKGPHSIEDALIMDINHRVTSFESKRMIKTHIIGVNYHEDSKDMHRISSFTGLTPNEIITIHTTPDYDVHFVGFLPGFIYLGGMDERLCIPRKAVPEQVNKGAVAIAGKQTGIYPQISPGGWTTIGETTYPLFDANANPPMTIKAGDYIKFEERQ